MPFAPSMKVGGASTQVAYDVAVAQKVQQSVKQGGKQAMQLIDASMMASSQPPAGTGEIVNIKA